MKRELNDSQAMAKLAESRVMDAHEQLEMVMLDKEVAEERAELAEAELEDVKEKYAILEVENEVLKAGAYIIIFLQTLLTGLQRVPKQQKTQSRKTLWHISSSRSKTKG
jgi:hypothetical protein